MDIGRAKIAGFDARNIAARLKLDASGLAIERLSVGDLGDTSFVASGRIQTQSPPGGSITVNLDARDLNGMLALTEKFAPALAGPLRRLAARQKTATLQASVRMESSGADGASGKIGLTGKIGAVRVNVSASATGKREAFTGDRSWARWPAPMSVLDGQFEADGPGPLLGLLGLDRSSRPSRSRRGSTCRRTGRSAANCASKASSPPGRSMPAARARCGSRPISRRRSISISSPGTIGGSKVQGRWALRFGDMPRLDGSIEAEIARCAGGDRGGDRHAGQARAAGPAGPPSRSPGARPALNGRIAFKAQRAVFAPWLVAQQLSGVARFERLGGRVRGRRGRIRQGPPRRPARGFERRRRADGAALRSASPGPSSARSSPVAERPATSGRLTLQTEIEGAGRSPAAFIGSLTGFGTITLEQARLVGLNPECSTR